MRLSLLGSSSFGLSGLVPFVVAPFMAACSAPLATPAAGDSVEKDAEGASSAALVVVERTITAEETTHGSAVARFIRMRAGSVDDQTLRMVGATLDVPALGTCVSASELTLDVPARDSALDAPSLETPRAVELLDVGALSIEANGVRSTLGARALPDIVDLVTGVLYSTDVAGVDQGGLPTNAGYVVRSTGSTRGGELDHGVPSFAIAATAPSEPEELRIDGQDARALDGVLLTTGEHVDVSWTVPDGSDPDDVVYVDLVPSASGVEGNDSAASVRCLFADRGAASIPASAFAGRQFAGSQAGEVRVEMTHGVLVVHRVHREAFHVGGVDSGVIRFDFARAAEFSRR